MEDTDTVILLNKVFHPVKCRESMEAYDRLSGADSSYFETEEFSTKILNYCGLVYDIKPDTELEIIMTNRDIKRIIKLPSALFTAQNPLVRCACIAEIHAKIPVRYKAMYIHEDTMDKLQQITFQLGGLKYEGGRIVDNPIL